MKAFKWLWARRAIIIVVFTSASLSLIGHQIAESFKHHNRGMGAFWILVLIIDTIVYVLAASQRARKYGYAALNFMKKVTRVGTKTPKDA